MTTNEINATRLDLYNGNEATLLVAATRWRLLAQEQQRRIVAISNGFVVTAPVAPVNDPAVEKWIADGAPTCGCRWTGNYSDVEPTENRPGYIGD